MASILTADDAKTTAAHVAEHWRAVLSAIERDHERTAEMLHTARADREMRALPAAMGDEDARVALTKAEERVMELAREAAVLESALAQARVQVQQAEDRQRAEEEAERNARAWEHARTMLAASQAADEAAGALAAALQRRKEAVEELLAGLPRERAGKMGPALMGRPAVDRALEAAGLREFGTIPPSWPVQPGRLAESDRHWLVHMPPMPWEEKKVVRDGE
ncbi:MAG: hypothetical protein IT165_32060 [Bryobacterales bacterium]|nr:hypothetical protein [Bryobacterales bacterium]